MFNLLRWLPASYELDVTCWTLCCDAMQRMYVTLFPCNECAKLMIQAGIVEVVYYEVRSRSTVNPCLAAVSRRTA